MIPTAQSLVRSDWEGAEYAAKMLDSEEGLTLTPYRCPAGKLTIGVGHNLDDKPISQRAALVILFDDIEDAREDLIEIFGADYFQSLSPPRQLALVNMMFALGRGSFDKFKGLIAAVKAGDWAVAAYHVLSSKWHRDLKAIGRPGEERTERVARMLKDDVIPYSP